MMMVMLSFLLLSSLFLTSFGLFTPWSRIPSHTSIRHSPTPSVRYAAITSRFALLNSESDKTVLLPPSFDDMNRLAYILSNVTERLNTAPELAMSIVSQEMDWLFQRDVPKLTQMILTELPELRKDQGMMRAYIFLLDFLEAISNETANRLKSHQHLLRSLLEVAKISEDALNDFFTSKADKLLANDFKVYLESEIEAAESNSPAGNLLVTVQLRVLEEEGKRMGVDIALLPRLAAEADPAELRRKTTEHLQSYDAVGRSLFLQTLRIMLAEINKRYKQVDPLLLLNLREVEKIAQGFVDSAAAVRSTTGSSSGSDNSSNC